MVKQSRTDLQLAAGVNLFYKWFVDAVPVFKSRFQVALDEVNGGEKIASIGIVRIDLQAVTEPGCCFPIAILFVRDTAQLDGKSLIARLQFAAMQKCAARFLPASELGKGAAIVVVNIRVPEGESFDSADDLGPMLLFKELFNLRQRRVVSRARRLGIANDRRGKQGENG